MNKKNLLLLILSISLVLLVSGCSKKEKSAVSIEPEPDAVTTASIVNDASSLRKALSQDGTWIVAVLQDMTLETEIVVDGQFTQKDKPYRKLAFYAQDADRKITDRYTVTAPRMTVKSENTRIQSGTFSGDVYVEANGFHLVDGKVDGNIYFLTQEYLDSFTMDGTSSVTGVTELQ